MACAASNCAAADEICLSKQGGSNRLPEGGCGLSRRAARWERRAEPGGDLIKEELAVEAGGVKSAMRKSGRG